jgi:hypothetical protein
MWMFGPRKEILTLYHTSGCIVLGTDRIVERDFV